jgi:predicted nuclease of predicted toxin-antitoxin system
VGAVIITKDEDFVVRKLFETGPPVVWVRIGNTSVTAARTDLPRQNRLSFQVCQKLVQ